jgi:hypothetical protein
MQVGSMDDDLRNGLWNALTIFYWKGVTTANAGGFKGLPSNKTIEALVYVLWDEFFKRRLDTIPYLWTDALREIRDYYFKYVWYEVYDFIEFAATKTFPEKVRNDFCDYCNMVLKRELSGYRFVNERIAQITSEEEIKEIEEALTSTDSLKSVTKHLSTALSMLSDRRSPDYRNSIKESVSAVEALCDLISGEKATLAQALKEIESKIEIHAALKKAFDSLYGYTSDADGIRHALLEKTNLYFEDAKFMLVSCSAFINYLVTKVSKTGI